MEAGTISNHVTLGQPFHFSEAYFQKKKLNVQQRDQLSGKNQIFKL